MSHSRRPAAHPYIPRFRQGYATMGGLLMGQTQGTFTDNDSDPELLDFGGTTATLFVGRTPQVRYTYPLPNCLSIPVAAENPNPNFAGPFGAFFTDTNQIPNSAACAALTTSTATNTTNITNSCLGNSAFFNPSQDIAPTLVARWRIEQPWGHIQAGLNVAPGLFDAPARDEGRRNVLRRIEECRIAEAGVGDVCRVGRG